MAGNMPSRGNSDTIEVPKYTWPGHGVRHRRRIRQETPGDGQSARNPLNAGVFNRPVRGGALRRG